jgi:hypothetical protein
MTIKQIFDEITNEPGTNQKMVILDKYKGNMLLKQVLYLANSKRVKFYIKQIPTYTSSNTAASTLEVACNSLTRLSDRLVTGHAAIAESDDAYIIERIIEKDCRLGMGTTNINKIFKVLLKILLTWEQSHLMKRRHVQCLTAEKCLFADQNGWTLLQCNYP